MDLEYEIGNIFPEERIRNGIGIPVKFSGFSNPFRNTRWITHSEWRGSLHSLRSFRDVRREFQNRWLITLVGGLVEFAVQRVNKPFTLLPSLSFCHDIHSWTWVVQLLRKIIGTGRNWVRLVCPLRFVAFVRIYASGANNPGSGTCNLCCYCWLLNLCHSGLITIAAIVQYSHYQSLQRRRTLNAVMSSVSFSNSCWKTIKESSGKKQNCWTFHLMSYVTCKAKAILRHVVTSLK